MAPWSFLCDTRFLPSSTSTCSTLVVSSVLHLTLVYLALLLLYLNSLCAKRRRQRPHSDTDTSGLILRFHHVHHDFFWINQGLLLLLNATRIAATVLGMSEGVNLVNNFSYVSVGSSLLGLVGLTVASVYYQVVESRGKSEVWLLLLIVYYGLVGVVMGAGTADQEEDLFFQVDVCVVAFQLIGALLLAHTVYYQRRTKRREKSSGVGEGVVYIHELSTLLSRLTFFWFTKLLRTGYSTPLEERHLGILPRAHTTHAQLQRFRQHEGQRLLWPLLWNVVGPSMLLGGLFRLLADLAGFVAPLGIKSIVSYSGRRLSHKNDTILANGTEFFVQNETDFGPGGNVTEFREEMTLDTFLENGYIMALVVLVASLLQSTFSQCSTYLVNTEGLHVKVALQGLIYEKSLRVLGRLEETTNLMTEDANNVMMFFWMAHFVWAIPLKLLVLMGLLYFTLGWAALIAAALCILTMIPLQFLIATLMSSNSKKLLERGDERLCWMSEMVANMRLLKTHGWETHFGQRLKEIRHQEGTHLDNDLLYRSLMTFLTHISTVVVTVVTFGLYPYLEESRLEPSRVFAGLALFNQLTVPLFIFPITVPVVIDALVSGRRIQEFLSLPEMTDSFPLSESEEGIVPAKSPVNSTSTPSPLKSLGDSTDSVFVLENIAEDEEEDNFLPGAIDQLNGTSGGGHGATETESEWTVRIHHCSFSWVSGDPPVLSNITVDIRKSKLTVVVGPTGAGKSSLLSAILGELHSSGRVLWAKSKQSQVAYASQNAWILNGTVRDNIVFGRGFKARRYKRVLEACSLQADLDILPEGDGTELGDRGVNLSGGQKQRIAIARALYSTAPFVILDDPLSALDVEVATDVFNVGILKLLIGAKRTVLLVTHHLAVLHHAHHIVAMESGRIRMEGTLAEIKEKDPELSSHWHDMIAKKEDELKRMIDAKTAKERWRLLKLVSKIGFRAKPKPSQDSGLQQHFRSRKGTFSHYKNLSHDFILPSDECHDEILAPILRRKPTTRNSKGSRASASSTKHVALHRLSSLQAPETGQKSTFRNFSRLTSVPASEDLPPPSSPRRYRSELNRLVPATPTHTGAGGLFKFFSPKKTVSSAGSSELELAVPASPLTLSPSLGPSLGPSPPLTTLSLPVSSVQSEGDLTEYDPQEGDELLDSGGEEREYGRVPLHVYLVYVSACGHLLSGSYFLFAIGYEVVRVLTSFWLSRWSDSVSQEESDQDYEQRMSYFFHVYVFLSIATVVVSLTCNLLGKAAGSRSRRLLHDRFVHQVIAYPVPFFDLTPIGRIMGRASSDVAVVDRKLCISMQRFVQFILLCLSAIVVNGVVNPWFLFVAVPLVAIYYAIQRFYRFSSRELQRLQAISRGPIYSHFHETLQGLSTIRAYGRQKAYTDHMFACIDLNNRADMFINVGNRWLSISLDYLGSVIVAVASVAAILSSDLYPDLVTPSIVGLAINYTLLVPVYLNWVVKFLAEVEMFMNSVDRLDRYSTMETEDYYGVTPPPDWPSKGSLSFEQVTISYDSTSIISDLNLQLNDGEKVGLCGRSGCGKSTLLSSLFRLSGHLEGRILLDGIDIATVPLQTLRSSISIIPQHSYLFTAPLRFNLDPGSRATDTVLWRALDLAQMKEAVEQLPNGLDEVVGPDSFSVGQRQLVALAIAIVHKSKVVLMDEATSSVDVDTEATLLKVVKEVFKDSTVLSIAHRLGTIVDGDRVLVLEEGKVIEDGSPQQLMARRPRSAFANMLRADVNANSNSTL